MSTSCNFLHVCRGFSCEHSAWGTKVLSRLHFIPGFLGSRQTFCFFWIFGSITNIEASAAASGLTGFASSTRHLQPKTHHTRACTRASSPALPLTPASCHPRATDTPARAQKMLPGHMCQTDHAEGSAPARSPLACAPPACVATAAAAAVALPRRHVSAGRTPVSGGG